LHRRPVSGRFWQAIQPISAVALPLPAGASTEATLALIKAKTDNLDVLLSTRTKPADAQHVTIDNASVAVTGTFFQATQPVSLASVPTHGVTGTFWQATQPVSGTFWRYTARQHRGDAEYPSHGGVFSSHAASELGDQYAGRNGQNCETSRPRHR
jgi:hypothetical protein